MTTATSTATTVTTGIATCAASPTDTTIQDLLPVRGRRRLTIWTKFGGNQPDPFLDLPSHLNLRFGPENLKMIKNE